MNEQAVQSPNQDPYEAAYLDAARFPLTTQSGLTLPEQKMIDAINKDDILRLKESGEPLQPDLEAIWKEFEAKAALKPQASPTPPGPLPPA